MTVVLELFGELSAELREGLGELADEVDMAQGRLIPDGDIARGLVGDVNIVALIAQADESAAHRDDIVVRVGREDEDPLGEGP